MNTDLARQNAILGRANARAGSGARVGASSDDVKAHANEFSARLRAFEEEVEGNPAFKPVKSASGPHKFGYDSFPSESQAAHKSFHVTLADLHFDWYGTENIEPGKWYQDDPPNYKKGAYKEITGHFWGLDKDMDAIDEYGRRLDALKKTYSKLGYTVTSVEPDKAPPPKSPIDLGLGDIGATVKTVVWIAALGAIAYFGFVYVVPLFLGAATQTKLARREYRNA